MTLLLHAFYLFTVMTRLSMTKRAKRNRQWWVVLAAHLAAVVCSATVRSVSIFLVEWRRYFQSSVAEVSAVSSFVAAAMLIAGNENISLCKVYIRAK